MKGAHQFLLVVNLLTSFISLTQSVPIKLTSLDDPELTAGYFEGDIVLPSIQRNGLRSDIHRWPNNLVPYKFSTELDHQHREHILRAMRLIAKVSCIRFTEADENTKDYVNITGDKGGCYSAVGWTQNGAQPLNLAIAPLNVGCFRLGTIIHEFLHTLGFFHMQSAANRDDYVRIVVDNVVPNALHNFDKYDDETVDNFDQEYDLGSVLHYSAYAFSSNGERTIVPVDPKNEEAAKMGQRVGMSRKDIDRLNTMYRCPFGTL